MVSNFRRGHGAIKGVSNPDYDEDAREYNVVSTWSGDEILYSTLTNMGLILTRQTSERTSKSH